MEGSSFLNAMTTLVIILLLTTYMNPCIGARPSPNNGDHTNTEFLKISCGNTTCPDLCFTTLSSYASQIGDSPKLLATTALSVTLTAARSTSTTMAKLAKTQQGMKQREALAMADCVQELGDSVDVLKKSIEEMEHGVHGAKNIEMEMSDTQTWVSAALTDENTCMDGFAGEAMNGNMKSTMRNYVVKVAHKTSNALALVNNYAALIQNP